MATDTLSIEVGAPEVNYLDYAVVIHYVLELYITMDDMIAVEFLQAQANLVDDVRDNVYWEMARMLQTQVVEIGLNDGKMYSLNKLSDDVHCFPVLEVVNQLDDMLTVDFVQNL